MKTMLISLGLILASAAAADNGFEFPRESSDPVLARVEGKPLTLEDLGEWAFRSVNSSALLENYVTSQLFVMEGKKRGLHVGPEEVEELVGRRLRNAAAAQRDNEVFMNLARWEAESDLYAYKLIRLRNPVTDEAVRKRFEKAYGPGGRLVHAGVAFLWIRESYLRPDQPGFEEARAHLIDSITEKMNGVFRDVSAERFPRMVQGREPVPFRLLARGRNVTYRPGMYGPSFDEAFQKTRPGKVSPVVVTEYGCHVFQIDPDKPASFQQMMWPMPAHAPDHKKWAADMARTRKLLERGLDKPLEAVAGEFPECVIEHIRTPDDYRRWNGIHEKQLDALLKDRNQGESFIVETAKGVCLIRVDGLVETDATPERLATFRDDLEKELPADDALYKLGLELLKKYRVYYETY